MKTIKVECQNIGCENMVDILEDTPYNGILCSECMKPNVFKKEQEEER